jgi:ferrous iron transport protein B
MAQVYGVQTGEAEAVQSTFFEDAGQIVTSFVGATVDTIKSVPLIVGIDLFEEEAEDQTELMNALRLGFERTGEAHGALAAYAFLIFVLLYTPCVVTIAAEKQELGARWMWFSVIGQFGLAWLAALVVFQGGKLVIGVIGG